MRYYLSNMQNINMELVAAAITSSGRRDIHIDPEPMPVDLHGHEPHELMRYTADIRTSMLGDYFSIYVTDNRDCSDFWAEFDRLGKTDYWRTFFRLAKEE